MKPFFARFAKDQSGMAAEFGLIAGLIAFGLLTAFTTVGTGI